MFKEKWRLLQTGFRPGAYNMALDDALCRRFDDLAAAGQTPPPVLRFYGWNPPALSLGYAQRAEREVDFEACRQQGIEWVRRPTGGRAILHDRTELTYSLVAGVDDPSVGGSVLESYSKISGALLEGLRLLGVEAELAGKQARGEAGAVSSACFDAPSAYEVTVAGRKIIGSAQARRRLALLQQGTILLEVDVEKLFSVLRPPPRLSRAQAAAQVAARLTSISQARGRATGFEEAQAAFGLAFSRHFGFELCPSRPDEAEELLAGRLASEKYGNPAWNMARQRPLPAYR